MGNVFENLVVSEALKARYNAGAEPNLFFFRNSKGLEIDLLLKENRLLTLFEVKSGKALNDEFSKNMRKFHELFPANIKQSEIKGTVIYSGENYESYKEFSYINFHNISDLFEPKEAPFSLNF